MKLAISQIMNQQVHINFTDTQVFVNVVLLMHIDIMDRHYAVQTAPMSNDINGSIKTFHSDGDDDNGGWALASQDDDDRVNDGDGVQCNDDDGDVDIGGGGGGNEDDSDGDGGGNVVLNNLVTWYIMLVYARTNVVACTCHYYFTSAKR